MSKLFAKVKSGNNYKCLIDGKWVSGKSKIPVKSPINDKVIGNISALSTGEIDKAYKAARKAQKAWNDTNLNDKAAILEKAADLFEENKDFIADRMVEEIGKPRKSCVSEVVRSAEFLRFTVTQARAMEGELYFSDRFPNTANTKMCLSYREPLGVILAIAPFNYPINLSISKIGPALITGNTVMLKPPSHGSISALLMGPIFEEAGLPAGVLNIVTGKGSEIGDHMVEHEHTNMIAFTGSSHVGHKIAKLAGMKRLLFELGGKDAAIVLEDADLDLAAKAIVSGAFSYYGQRCTAIKRVLVMEQVADQLVKKLVPMIEKLRIGNPKNNVDIGPVINDSAADKIQSLVDDAVKKGAKFACGCDVCSQTKHGKVFHPILLDKVTTKMDLAWEEPFGPVLPIIRIKSIDQAIKIANESEYGLQSSVFTNNVNNAFNIARQLEVGNVQINGRTERGPDNFPFAGVKDSGLGTQGVKYTMLEMTRVKSIVLNFP